MAEQPKIRVAVLYGGRSAEHEVSLVSATSVIQNLDRTRFEVIPIGIDKQGTWFLGDDLLPKELQQDDVLLQLKREPTRMFFAPDQLNQQLQVRSAQFPQSNKNNGRMFDVVFPVIHGSLCEDGTVQGLLELAELPYVGSGVLGSAVTMDKDVSKRLASHAGIAVAPYLTIKAGQWRKNPQLFCARVGKELAYPVFVKPANAGSSIGIQKIKKAEDLATAIDYAFQFDVKVVVEKGLDALELEMAVLESLDFTDEPIVSVVGEVRPTHEFYSYAAKYLDENGAELIIPAPIAPEIAKQAKQIARQLFAALECETMARVDLFLEKGTNKLFFNEINSIPGFTPISMYPKLLKASGVSYAELLTHLIQLALDRHSRKSKISYDYKQECPSAI